MPIMKPDLDLATIQENIKKNIPTISSKRESFSNKLEEAGAGLETCAKILSEIVQFGDDDNTRLRALELTLKGHNALDEKDRGDGSIHFHFGNGQVNLQNIFNPPRPESKPVEPLEYFLDKTVQ